MTAANRLVETLRGTFVTEQSGWPFPAFEWDEFF